MTKRSLQRPKTRFPLRCCGEKRPCRNSPGLSDDQASKQRVILRKQSGYLLGVWKPLLRGHLMFTNNNLPV